MDFDARMQVASRIRWARLERKMSQAELAAAVGIRPETVSRYENGKTSPSMVRLEAIAKALGVAVKDFLL